MSKQEKKVEIPTTVITGVVRLSYANLWEPKSINGGKEKYSVSLLIPKTDTVTLGKINNAVKAAYTDGQAKLKGNGKTVPQLSALKTPLRDGDTERPDDEAYQGHFFVNANSDIAPIIVDLNRREITERRQIYSGAYARAQVNFYAYNAGGASRGIACGLNGIQKVRDGESLGGRGNVAEDFDDGFIADEFAGGDDDFLN